MSEQNQQSSSSQDLMNKLNRRGRCETKPILKPSQMVIDFPYPVQGIKNVLTKYGPCTMVILDDNCVFLPKRMSMTDAEALNLTQAQIGLVYKGTKKLDLSPNAINVLEFTHL